MRTIIFLILAVLPAESLLAAYGNIVWKNPTPTAADFFDVASNPSLNLFVLVGEAGTLATAPDGRTWTYRNSGTPHDLHAIALSDARAVAVGAAGTVRYSADGINWSAAPQLPADLYDVVYAAGKFIAVGKTGGGIGFIASSIDGNTWVEANPGTGAGLHAIAYQNGAYVAVGSNGEFTRSQDGINWTAGTIMEAADLVAVAPGNGVFVALSSATEGIRIFTSTTGQTWQGWSAPNGANGLNLNAIAYQSGLYLIAADASRILTGNSFNTLQLREVNTQVASDYLGVSGSILGWNLVGRGGVNNFSLTGLDNWTFLAQGAAGHYNDIAFGAGFYVAVGDEGRVAGSANGNTWVNRTNNNDTTLNALALSEASTWLAVGDNGTVRNATAAGDNWQAIVSPLTVDLEVMAYGDGRFYVGGADGSLFTTTNPSGLGLSAVSSPARSAITSLVYLNTQFLAGTADGVILRSTNGLDWATVFTNATGPITGFAFFDDAFWAVAPVGNRSVLYRSVEGVSWVQQRIFNGVNIEALAATGSWLAGIGGGGDLVSTRDGENWDSEPSVISIGLDVLKVINNQFYVTGAYSKIGILNVVIPWSVYFGPTNSLGGDWRESSWLGNFNVGNYPTIYLDGQGFWFCAGDGMLNGANSFWFYDFTLGWLWTAEGTYPWVYINDTDLSTPQNEGSWAFYGGFNGTQRSYNVQSLGGWVFYPLSGN